ncbi:nucleotidyltransferase family protein [Crocinitomix sp.]|nr:nucleotidyltransferase family protein [Crocinitomix sp.]
MSESNHITEAIVLAGGLGTRLRKSIGEFPKVLAPIAGKPFLAYLLDYLSQQGISTVVLAVGYKWELVQKEFGDNYKGIQIHYSIEKEPLGTGGAIKLASQHISSENCIAMNGDTLFTIDLKELCAFHTSKSGECSIALKPMLNSERYGSVDINDHNRILKFNEKEFREKSFINGGVYCLNLAAFNKIIGSEKFSFETDYLAKNANHGLFGLVSDAYFKDIGIPTDYEQFEKDIINNSIHGI